MQVLHHRHAEDLVPVPDKARGDAGLEAYTLNGLAYQCYSPEEPLSVGQRYAKHRDKMTTDVGKFIGNGAVLEPMFGAIKIRRWILLVPLADSRDLLAHAMRQAKRLQDAELTYADAEIFVLVRTLDNYQDSLNAVVNARLAPLFLPALQPAPDYANVHSDLIGTMHAKLAKVPKLAIHGKRHKYLSRLLSEYLHGRAHRDHIRDHYSELDGDLDHLLNDLEERLETQFALLDDPPEKMLLRVSADAEERVRRAIPPVRDGDARAIANGQVADWLMRCPMDFDESVDTPAN
jgi:hypothetical protein